MSFLEQQIEICHVQNYKDLTNRVNLTLRNKTKDQLYAVFLKNKLYLLLIGCPLHPLIAFTSYTYQHHLIELLQSIKTPSFI